MPIKKGTFASSIAEVPTVTTNAVTNFNQNQATVNGVVSANNLLTTYYFDYSTDPTFTSYMGTLGVTTSSQNLTVSANITGLSVGTLHYVRLRAVNAIGTTIGSTVSFTTWSLKTYTNTTSGSYSVEIPSISGVAPSVDNGVAANFGTRELVNRMQLVLVSLGITTRTLTPNMLVTAVLNGIPSSATAWTNAVNNATGVANSSLAQVANYAGGSTTVSGGEVTGGFFTQGTSTLELDKVRDLGNSILGGGGANANTNIYPDGPDVLTIVVTNTSSSAIDVQGRLSWTEAQA